MIITNSDTVPGIHHQINQCLSLLQHYEWLINSFVLDFFNEGHWQTLPQSWQQFLENISPLELANWLDSETISQPSSDKVWPLSLLALKQTLKRLSLPRKPVTDLREVAKYLRIKTNDNEDRLWQFDPELMTGSSKHHESLKHVFRKHVKPKKQYEMCRLGKLSSSVARSVKNVNKILDIGSGVGHLSRYLCYNHNMTVACVDGDDNLTVSARKFDEELEKAVEKMKKRSLDNDQVLDLPPAPVHVTCHISPDMNLDTFHGLLRENFHLSNDDDDNKSMLEYGLVGLHTCGDLAPVILRMFTLDPASVMINSLGCCYMKIKHHFPMSRHVSERTWHELTYTSTELSCHAIEVYTEKLRQDNNNNDAGEVSECNKLKVHCYRALLEYLLIRRNSKYRHTILKSVPKSHLLPFPEYAKRATVNLVSEGMEAFTDDELDNADVHHLLSHWWKVVLFYTIRLSFAPVIETVILLDRSLFLLERGSENVMFPLFDPIQSPRNQVIVAVKNL